MVKVTGEENETAKAAISSCVDSRETSRKYIFMFSVTLLNVISMRNTKKYYNLQILTFYRKNRVTIEQIIPDISVLDEQDHHIVV